MDKEQDSRVRKSNLNTARASMVCAFICFGSGIVFVFKKDEVSICYGIFMLALAGFNFSNSIISILFGTRNL